MKNTICILLSFIFLLSCTSYNQNNLNVKSAQLAHSKFNNINNNFTFDEYKSLIVKYGMNNEYPDITK